MPNDAGTYDESDTTPEAFDAMWASATPVETFTDIVVKGPGESFCFDGLTLSRTGRTNATAGNTPLIPSMPAPDTTASAARAVGTTNFVTQPA